MAPRALYTTQYVALARLLKKMGLAVRKKDKTVLRNRRGALLTGGECRLNARSRGRRVRVNPCVAI